MKCDAKHLKPNPPEEFWVCPKCGAIAGEFCLDHHHTYCMEEDVECDELAKGDTLECTRCGFRESARQFVNRYKRSQNLVLCPHCKGKGYVKKGK